MSKQFAKKSMVAALTTAALAFAAVTPVGASDQSDDWFEQQRSLTDGEGFEFQPEAAPPRAPKGPEGRVGKPAASPESRVNKSGASPKGQAGSKQDEWLEQQLELED
jgi:hypothetical protein